MEDLPFFDVRVFYGGLQRNQKKVFTVDSEGKLAQVLMTQNGSRRMYVFGDYLYVDDPSIETMAVFDKETKSLVFTVKKGVIYDMRDGSAEVVVGEI